MAKPTSRLSPDLVARMILRLENESAGDWTREFGASGTKTTPIIDE